MWHKELLHEEDVREDEEGGGGGEAQILLFINNFITAKLTHEGVNLVRGNVIKIKCNMKYNYKDKTE